VRVRDHLESLGIDRRTILNYNYNKYDGAVWTALALERDKWRNVENTEGIFSVS